MCGFTGFFLRRPSLQFDFDPNEKLGNMTNQIAHRGPDAIGYWKDALLDCFWTSKTAILDRRKR